jgi:hypothetical protein
MVCNSFELRCDLCGSGGSLEVVDLGNGVVCYPACLGDADAWYEAERERTKDNAPA